MQTSASRMMSVTLQLDRVQFGENCRVEFKKLQPPIPLELTRTEPWNNTYLKLHLNAFSIYLIPKIYKET